MIFARNEGAADKWLRKHDPYYGYKGRNKKAMLDYTKPKFKKKGKCNTSFYQRIDNFHQIDGTHIKITGIKTPVKIKKTDTKLIIIVKEKGSSSFL